MTREEEIHETAKQWICNSYSDSKMQEHEVAFTDEWLKEHKEQPTYADAIAWAEKRVIERAREWLNEELRRYSPFYSIVPRGQFIDKLVDWMEK